MVDQYYKKGRVTRDFKCQIFKWCHIMKSRQLNMKTLAIDHRQTPTTASNSGLTDCQNINFSLKTKYKIQEESANWDKQSHLMFARLLWASAYHSYYQKLGLGEPVNERVLSRANFPHCWTLLLSTESFLIFSSGLREDKQALRCMYLEDDFRVLNLWDQIEGIEAGEF